MGTLVNYATEKGVALLTLTDPPVNAYTYEMIKELDASILEARFDDDIHVLVITGHGEKYFCGGANVNMLKEADDTFRYYFCLHAAETLLRLENTPKLVVAGINGHCLGGGLELALACDLRIARTGQLQIGMTDLELGLAPGAGGTQRLARLVGSARAIELAVEARRLTVDEAAAAGLLHKTWSTDTHDAFIRRLVDYAHEFCPPNRPSLAVGLVKRAIQSGSRSGLEHGFALEREIHQRTSATFDAREGVAAFTQKRRPTFEGR